MGKRIWRALSALMQADRLDREAEDELAQHVEMAVAGKVGRGTDEAEARRQARIELGHPEVARERLRDGRPGSFLDAVRQDAVYAARMLRKRPRVSALCVLTIALGVGASTALFALVEAVVLKPLPFPSPESLVRVFDTNPDAGVGGPAPAAGKLPDLQRGGEP